MTLSPHLHNGFLLMPNAKGRVYSGHLPVAPTPFTESGDLDLEGQRRVLDCMIDQEVDGICILAN